MKLTAHKILTHSGHGSRKVAYNLIKKGHLSIGGRLINDPKEVFDCENLVYVLSGREYSFREFVCLAIDKPRDFEVSHKPTHHESVFKLIDPIFLNREVRAVGRLDVDTTGLLLFTDCGQLNRRLMAPKNKIKKTYLITLKHAVDQDFLNKLSEGVKLNDCPDVLVKALDVTKINEFEVSLSIAEGKYHQVKRMVASASNRVEKLRRTSIGGLSINDICFKDNKAVVLREDQIKSLYN